MNGRRCWRFWCSGEVLRRSAMEGRGVETRQNYGEDGRDGGSFTVAAFSCGR